MKNFFHAVIAREEWKTISAAPQHRRNSLKQEVFR